jgi:type I restriction enzyme S subunit
MAAVQAESGRIDTSETRPFGQLKTKSYRSFAEGDVLFAKITPCMENGKAAIARNLHAGCGFGSTEFHVLRTDAGINPDYVLQFVLQKKFRRDAARNMKGTAGQLRVPAAYLAEHRIPVPPTAEQERIVAAIAEQFSRLDAGAEALKRVRLNLKRMRAAVLQAAVTGRLPAEDVVSVEQLEIAEDPLASRLTGANLHKVKRAAADLLALTWDIPDSWTWKSASTVCDVIASGSTPTKVAMTAGHGEVPYIKVYNLTHSGELDFSVRPTFIDRATHEGPLRRSRLRPGDILTNIVGPPLGKVSVVPDQYPEWNTNQAVVVFRALPSLHPRLLKYWLLSPPILKMLASTSRATAGQFNVSLTTCRALPLPIPPRDQQDALVAAIEHHLSVVDVVEAALKRGASCSTHLRSSILAAAFSGALAPQDPNDEPASVLLERIAAERASSNRHKSTRARSQRRRKVAA